VTFGGWRYPLSESASPYTTRTNDGKQEVLSPAGRVIMTCADTRSAAHYAALLNEAYKAGYRAGYHDGRRN